MLTLFYGKIGYNCNKGSLNSVVKAANNYKKLFIAGYICSRL